MDGQNHGAATAADTHMISRLLFFSDAVFAIVLTLLVLELRPPQVESDAELERAILALMPNVVAFIASFALVSVFWAAHMAISRKLSAFDWPAAWCNLVFLFTIAVMPFASALIGEHGTSGTAWRAYSIVLIAASLAQTAFLLVLTRDKGRLVGGMAAQERAWRTVRALSPGIAFSVGLGLSLAGEDRLSMFCWLLIPVVLGLARLLFGARRARPAAETETGSAASSP